MQTQAFSASIAQTVTTAAAKVAALGGQVDGVLLDDASYWKLISDNSQFVFTLQQALGIRFVPSTGLAANSAVVGAFRDGAVLLDKQESSIARTTESAVRARLRISDSHDDYFTSNRVALLAEQRAQLAVHGAALFVSAALV